MDTFNAYQSFCHVVESLSLKMQILAFFSNQKLVINGNNSYQKQCFMEIALPNMKTYIQKLSYVLV